ncbi:MAG: hypothetical protein ACLGQX_14690 [Acidobacteriota bacterium]
MHVEALGLEGGQAIRDGEELLSHCGQMLQALLEAEIAQVVGADLIAQEGGKLLVLLDEGVLPVSSLRTFGSAHSMGRS